MKYIDAEKLIAEIDKKWKELADKNVKIGGGKYDIEISTYLSIKNLITSLQQEQPEVDLEKEIEEWWQNWVSPPRNEYAVFDKEEFINIVRHFYELGLNAKSDAPKIKGWVARDKGAKDCCLYFNKPVRHTISWVDKKEDGDYNDDYLFLQDLHLEVEDVSWEDEPIEVVLIIKKV